MKIKSGKVQISFSLAEANRLLTYLKDTQSGGRSDYQVVADLITPLTTQLEATLKGQKIYGNHT